MRKLDILQKTLRNKVIETTATMVVFFMSHPVYAQAQQALTNAKNALTDLKTDLTTNIIPVAAALILLCLAIGYAGRYIGKDTFVRWSIGVVIAGSATELVKMFFKTT